MALQTVSLPARVCVPLVGSAAATAVATLLEIDKLVIVILEVYETIG